MKFFPVASRRAAARIDAQAAAWLARRDRGLSAPEQDEYLRWLSQDERHAGAIARAEATFRQMIRLSAWRQELSTEPNPDLFAPPRLRGWRWAPLAAAAVVMLGIGWWAHQPAPGGLSVVQTKSYLHVNERQVLPDGSSVELKDGSAIEVRYAAAERRVHLSGGEAQFSVMKDPARPFVVEAGGVAVRAVGTVFDVRLGGEAVEVVVSEGKVRVGRAAVEPGRIFQPHAEDSEPPTVAAGQRALVSLATVTASPVIANISSEELRGELAWQAPRLQFVETPLAQAVAEFNRRNRRQLVLGDANLGSTPIGGSFRPDNVDGFVRLLAVTLGVRAEKRGPDETVLYRAR